MQVTVLELPARWNKVKAALGDVEDALQGTQSQVTVLPEASLTGYLSPRGEADLRRFAEPKDGPTAKRLEALCRTHRTHLLAPLIEKDEEQLYNAVALFGPDGVVFHYRKRHPWYVEKWASPGAEAPPVVTVAGQKLTVAICFDVHFLPEVDAQLAQADVLLFPSAWVDEEGEDSRAVLLPQVAQRWNLHVVNANWGLGEPQVRGQGGSMVVAPDGRVLARTNGKTRRLDVTVETT